MTVAIIGTGEMGAGLVRLLVRGGIQVTIGSRDPAKAAQLAPEIGGGAQGSGIAEAVKAADVVILGQGPSLPQLGPRRPARPPLRPQHSPSGQDNVRSSPVPPRKPPDGFAP